MYEIELLRVIRNQSLSAFLGNIILFGIFIWTSMNTCQKNEISCN